MRLRLYHHADGARVAYRELGAGPALALFHSALLSHREWEPAVEQLSDRFRVVLPAEAGYPFRLGASRSVVVRVRGQ